MRTFSTFIQPDQAEKRCTALAEKHLDTMKNKADKCRTIPEKMQLIKTIMEETMKVIVYQCAYFLPGLKSEQKARKRLQAWFGEEDRIMDSILRGLPNSPTSTMGHELVELAYEYKKYGRQPSENDAQVRAFLQKFGHRSNVELDVGHPNWSEEPGYIINLIESYMEQDTDALQAKLNQYEMEGEEAAAALVERVEKVKGKRSAAKMARDCRYIRLLLGLREQPKFDLVRSFALIRQILLEVGEELVSQNRIQEKNDVFFLNRQDILEHSEPLFEKAAANRKTFAREKELKTIPRFMTNTGESLYESAAPASDKQDRLTGVPVSSGEFTGTVRVIHDPAGEKLKDGEILVTHSTDPSWTPLFLSAGA